MRADVYRLRPSHSSRGHEQAGRRFGIVVQATRLAMLSTWLVVPTSTRAQPAVFRPEIEIPGYGSTRALCDALSAVDPEVRLADLVGYLTLDEMARIDRAVLGLLDLD